ncbi:MAG: molybdenum cofactor guanylyltransferase [Candidatus Bathyarchaeia archaeon]
MDRSAIILVGFTPNKFGEDKGLLKLNKKPLFSYVVDSIKDIVEEIIIVTNSQQHADIYAKAVSTNAKFAVDDDESKGPLGGALTGFEAAQGKYSLLLPFDAPFICREIISLLFDLCIGKTAVVPRWTNCEIEPLHAVYRTECGLEAAKKALANNELELADMVVKMRGVRYVSTLVIEQLDPELLTFFNVNAPLDLKKALTMMKQRKK